MADAKVIRGGSWIDDPRHCRSAIRYRDIPDVRDYYSGFRVVCEIREKQMPLIEDLGNGITLELVQIPGGTFLMGSSDSESGRYRDESPQHEVTVPTFAMGKFQVTQAQYELVMGNNPSHFKGYNRPVETMSWNDAVEFCQKLSQQSGKTYRLPSEAEWEYACRAGTTTPYFFGESLENQANYDSDSTTDVGSYPANDFGLYDMHGNLWEWCLDDWHDTYEGAPTDGSAWVIDADGEFDRRVIIRGGSWVNNPRHCRSADRGRVTPGVQDYGIGFRVVCETGGL